MGHYDTCRESAPASAKNQLGDVATPLTSFGYLHQQALEAAGRVHELRVRLANHNDRLFGPMPETTAKVAGAGGAPSALGALGELMDTLTHLHSQIDYLTAEVDRGTALA